MEQNSEVRLFQEAFSGEDGLSTKVIEAYTRGTHIPGVFRDIARHVLDLKGQIGDLKRKAGSSSLPDEPAAKKRKAETEIVSDQVSGKPILVATDISFAVPVRKKLTLEVLASTSPSLVAKNAAGGVELQMPMTNIEQIICVPVPDKAQPATYFAAIPRAETSTDAIVWTVPVTEAKTVMVHAGQAVQAGESYETVLRRVLDDALAPQGRRVVRPDSKEFVSSLVQSHRKDEKAFHVKAFKGSKEGYLYFLPPGILFGFRKPVLFFPFAAVTSISYSSVLQRTFNLNITTDTEELEFAMLDQGDFEGIDKYVKGHGLHDASLAESRKAKRYNVNKQANGQAAGTNGEQTASTGDGQGGEEEEESALAKAERELQDAEDEEEEDFDPGSGGESDGSGSDSDGEGYAEDEDVGGGGEGEDAEREEDQEGEEYEEDLEEPEEPVEEVQPMQPAPQVQQVQWRAAPQHAAPVLPDDDEELI